MLRGSFVDSIRRIETNNRCPPAFFGGRFRARAVGEQPTWLLDGSRTRDRQIFNLMLYPLSYLHRCRF